MRGVHRTRDGQSDMIVQRAHPADAEHRCYWHNRVEPVTPSTYRVCGECFHVYETPDDLLYEECQVRASYDEPIAGLTVDTIYSCPLCVHDW